MKFLCLECDEPMALREARPPDRGSIAAIYECPSCGRGTAMLTNQWETEVVRSLGVKIGPGSATARAAGEGEAVSGGQGSAADRAAAGGCPFSGMIEEATAKESEGIVWTQGALARLENIPEFVRPMARQGIEHYARDAGLDTVDEEVLERARGRFGM